MASTADIQVRASRGRTTQELQSDALGGGEGERERRESQSQKRRRLRGPAVEANNSKHSGGHFCSFPKSKQLVTLQQLK